MNDARQSASPGQAGDKGSPAGALTPVVEGGGSGPASGASVTAQSAVAPTGAPTSADGAASQMSAPVAVRLAAVMGGGVSAPVEVTPATLTLIADPAGPLGRNTLSLVNGAGAEQIVWLSYEAPDLLTIAVEQPVPSRATLLITVDLAYAASLSARAARATIYVTTPTSTVPVQVNWRPLPYGRM